MLQNQQIMTSDLGLGLEFLFKIFCELTPFHTEHRVTEAVSETSDLQRVTFVLRLVLMLIYRGQLVKDESLQ